MAERVPNNGYDGVNYFVYGEGSGASGFEAPVLCPPPRTLPLLPHRRKEARVGPAQPCNELLSAERFISNPPWPSLLSNTPSHRPRPSLLPVQDYKKERKGTAKRM
jgi:hypothetical protein